MNTAINTPPPDLRQTLSASLNQLRERQAAIALAILLLGMILALILHLSASYHFPIPWDDESHFLVPARNIASGLGLVAPQLNAPQGLFWMPDGYVLLMGGVFAITGPSLAVARWVSFALVIVCAACLYLSGKRLGLPPVLVALLVMLWLIAPRVVILGNTARMEVLVITMCCIALALAIHDHWLKATLVAALMPLAHPIGLPLFVIFPLAAVVFGRSLRLQSVSSDPLLNQPQSSRSQDFLPSSLRPLRSLWFKVLPSRALSWALLVGVTALWLFEIAHFAQFMDVVRAHLGYQFSRKDQAPILLEPLHLVVVAVNLHGALIAWLLTRPKHGTRYRAILAGMGLLFVLGGALVMVHPLGREQWYVVYSIEFTNIVTLMALVGMWTLLRSPDVPAAWKRLSFRVITALMALSMVFLILPNILNSLAQTEPVYSFANLTIAGNSSAEWAGFMDGVEAELTALDESLDEPALVQVDRMANLDTLLTDHTWQHLRLVQTTPVTPLAEDVRPDFMLFTSGPPLWRTMQVESRFPDADPGVHIVSSTGRFHLFIFDMR